MRPKAECKINGGGGGAGGFGLQQSHRIQVEGEGMFWNRNVKGIQLEQGRQAGASGRRYVSCVKGARVCMEGQKMAGIRLAGGVQLVVKRETTRTITTGVGLQHPR